MSDQIDKLLGRAQFFFGIAVVAHAIELIAIVTMVILHLLKGE